MGPKKPKMGTNLVIAGNSLKSSWSAKNVAKTRTKRPIPAAAITTLNLARTLQGRGGDAHATGERAYVRTPLQAARRDAKIL